MTGTSPCAAGGWKPYGRSAHGGRCFKSRTAWRRLVAEEDATAATHALSVYYPFCLIEVIGVREGDDHPDTGEVLLSFLDADGCQVTLRLSPAALAALRKRIPEPPDPNSK